MKIALISQPFDAFIPPSMNSIGIWINEISRRLARDHEVIVYGRRGIASRCGIGENVTTKYFSTLPHRWWSRLDHKLLPHLPKKKPLYSNPVYYMEYILPIALDLKRERVEVVHLQNFSQFIPIIRAINPRIKIVLHMRCEWLTLLDYEMIEKRIDQADLVLGVSKYITDRIRERFPEQAMKCETAYTGVDIQAFKPRHPDRNQQKSVRRILYVGRITPEKGTHILIEAFKQIAASTSNIHLDLVGAVGSMPKDFLVGLSGEQNIRDLEVFYSGTNYRTYLDDILPEMLKDCVHYEGNVDYTTITKYYQQADILVNPALNEPFGRSLIEGGASGLPIISSNVGGMTELIHHGQNGLLVPSGNADLLAKALLSLLEDEPLMRQMGSNGRQFVVDHFSWDETKTDLLRVYQQTIFLKIPYYPTYD